MKKTIALLLAATAITGNLSSQKIKGSDTVLPLSQELAEEYMKNHASARLTVIGGGSGVGIAALIDGTTDIAMSSRKMKMDEKLKLQEAGRAYKEAIIAYDALSVIVNPANTVTQLTREQIEGIYTGKFTNWNQVGGANARIVVYARETSSGTYEFFKEHVLKRKNYATSVLNMPATGAIMQSVAQTQGAIGYVGLAYIDGSVKTLKVSFDQGVTYVAPSMAAAKNKTYPITRPLYYYYLTSVQRLVTPFINYVLSALGQAIVERIGYVPLSS